MHKVIPSFNVARLVRSMTSKFIGADICRSLGETSRDDRSKKVRSPTLTEVSIKSDALSSCFVSGQKYPFISLLMALLAG